MNNIKYPLVISISLFVSACATLNKSECRHADWQIIGLEDGSRGRPISYISKHRKACAEHGVSPDLTRYQDGHAAGLTQFCTAEMGFAQGKRGRHYNGVCPAELRGDFLYGYERGRELYLLQKEINQINSYIKNNETLLESMQTSINELELQLISKTGSTTQRLAMLQELKKQQTSYTTLENEFHNLELDAARLQGEYDVLNSQHGF
jgi:hypothetical protein